MVLDPTFLSLDTVRVRAREAFGFTLVSSSCESCDDEMLLLLERLLSTAGLPSLDPADSDERL